MKNLIVRTLTGAGFVVGVVVALLLNKYCFGLLMILLMTAMMVEFFSITMRGEYWFSQILSILAAIVLFVLTFLYRGFDFPGRLVVLAIIPVFVIMINSLYVKDKTEGEDGLFRDYGLYTQVEQINKAYLRSHGFDSEGNLYQAGSFDWGRHADVLVNATDASYNLEAFEEYLEVKGSEDHSKLLAMLDAVRDSEVYYSQGEDAETRRLYSQYAALGDKLFALIPEA